MPLNTATTSNADKRACHRRVPLRIFRTIKTMPTRAHAKQLKAAACSWLALPQAKAVFHTHMPFASALSRLDDPHILPIGQTELGTLIHTAYDDHYDGPAFDPAEGERLASVIGDKTILMMANHGAATVGRTVAEAYDALYYLERVAQVQLYAMWTGRPLKQLPQKVVDETIAEFKKGRNYGGKKPAIWHFEALKRILDRKEPDYKT